jgi:tetratricopeptide (TPR) repeat protein
MTPANHASDPSARRDRITWSLLIFSFALLVRGLHVWQLQGSLVLDTIMGDARSYDSWARQIAAGDWLGNEVFYQAPLYPYFLAILYSSIGDETVLVRGFQALVGAGSCVLLALAGWRFFSKPVGITAGLLLAVYAPAIFADTTIQKSVLDLFLLCLALWILGGIVDRPRASRCVGLGLSIGALVLSRENALVFALVLFPWLFLRSPSPGARRLILPALFLTGMAVVLFPVALRNGYVGGELHLTTSQLGPNFYIGNNAAADGSYAPLRPGRGDPKYERQDATELAEMALGRELTPAEVSSFFLRSALQYIRSEPGDWSRLMARKFSLAFNSVEVVDTVDQYTHAESSLPLRLASWVFHFGVLAPLALLGVWITWPERVRLLPLHLLFLAYTASLVAFYVFGRYRLPLAPFLVLFAAAGLVRFRRFATTNPLPRVFASILAVGAAALFCNWPIVDKSYMRSVTHYNLGNELFSAGRTGEAVRQYREAIRLHADNAKAIHNLGAVLARQGDLAGAKEHYERALRIAPDYADARFNLARTLWETGDPMGAIESYESGLRVDANRAAVYGELGLVYTEIGELDLAIGCFERALQIDPDLREARQNLHRANAERRGRGGEAEPTKRASSVCPR